MEVIYNKIDGDTLTLKEGNDVLFEIRNAISHTQVEYIQDLNNLCDELNKENIYDCGTCFYVIDEQATHLEILETINS